MSEKMIARWNAIPLERPDEFSSLKRRRNEDQDDSGDDISLVSRSPSPRLGDAMDVDRKSLGKYDEYHRGPAREVITVETKLKPTNKGFELLSKFGWKQGQPVGLDPEGRTEPVPFYIKSDLTGLGKVSQDVEMIETTVSQRRGLDSERQQRETEEQRKAREDIVARKSALEAEISTTLRAFYCELCDKQFKNVAQYDEHTNSYAHHHKARYRDMQANIRIKPQAEIDKLKEKERKREEKELRKIAAAQGIKMPKAPASSMTVEPVQPTTSTPPSMDMDTTPVESSKGWATISNPPEPSASSGGGFKKSGWASVGSSSFAPPPPSNPAPPPPPPSEAPPVPPPSKTIPNHTPSFRNAGWTTLDTASAPLMPPPQSGNASLSTGNGWSQISTSNNPPTSGSWSRGSFTSAQAPLRPPLTDSTTTPSPSSTPASALLPAPAAPEPSTSGSGPPPVRSNWQKFQKGAGRRK